MKLLQAYIETNGKIEKEPFLIHKFIKINKRTFEFGEGFNVKV
jgi:hypothetical protein